MNRRLRTQLDQVRPSLQDKVGLIQAKQKAHHDQHAWDQTRIESDPVYVRSYTGPKWSPAVLVKQTRPVSWTARLQDGRLVRKHQDQIRPCYNHQPAISRLLDKNKNTLPVDGSQLELAPSEPENAVPEAAADPEGVASGALAPMSTTNECPSRVARYLASVRQPECLVLQGVCFWTMGGEQSALSSILTGSQFSKPISPNTLSVKLQWIAFLRVTSPILFATDFPSRLLVYWPLMTVIQYSYLCPLYVVLARNFRTHETLPPGLYTVGLESISLGIGCI